jgi:hypothetical protein
MKWDHNLFLKVNKLLSFCSLFQDSNAFYTSSNHDKSYGGSLELFDLFCAFQSQSKSSAYQAPIFNGFGAYLCLP